MEKTQRLVIRGGNRLAGELKVHGAKNSALPLLSACVLAQGESVLHNCPILSDVDAACRILTCIGCKCTRDGDTVTVNASVIDGTDVPDKLMREMRSSIVFLGAILGRMKKCRLSFPGGCELGPRPIDLHLSALKKLGVEIKEEHGYLDCCAPKGLRGNKIALSFPSVGATENIMLAAVTAQGITEIQNAALEPEISDLADFLNKCGAKINGAGTSNILIEGVEKLDCAEHSVIPDRIVAVTYLCSAAITRGELVLSGVNVAHIASVIHVLESMGCSVYPYSDGKLYISAKKPLCSSQTIRTMPYPGFPTDSQALIMALATSVKGTNVFVETIFENRFKHVSELIRLGASIKVEGKVAIVQGVDGLSGAELEAADLRGGAALVVAGLFADGETVVRDIHHIDRGYECFEDNLRKTGADIRRISVI